jgi:hypothetical protein
MIMKRFGVLLGSAALGAALVASGPAAAFSGGHMGGGFGGGNVGGFGGRSMGVGGFSRSMGVGGFSRSVGVGGFNRGFGLNRGFAGVNRDMFAGRSAAVDNFNQFHRFHHFRNRFNNFAFFPFFGGDWDYGYLSADCGYWGSDYCGYSYPDYAYSYPDYGYDNGYGYPATGSSGYYAAAPLVTGRSVATGQLGSYCTISVKACELHHASNVGGSCSCRVPGGRARGLVTR